MSQNQKTQNDTSQKNEEIIIIKKNHDFDQKKHVNLYHFCNFFDQNLH